MNNNKNYYGNHRGGISIIARLPAQVAELYGHEWIFADPKERRAETLAAMAKERFPLVRPRPLTMTAQEAIAYSEEDDTSVLALDTVSGTRETLEARRPRQRTTFQLLGRAPGGNAGTRTALQGTIMPGDHDTERRAILLLHTLEDMTREASSRTLTHTDSLAASVLRPMRDLATRQTIRHLAEKERDPWDLSGGPLNIVLGMNVYPLVPVQSQPNDRYSHRKEIALNAIEVVPDRQLLDCGPMGHFAVVAVVIPIEQAIYFMTIAQTRTGKRQVQGVTVFEKPVPVPKLIPSPVADTTPAIFTD